MREHRRSCAPIPPTSKTTWGPRPNRVRSNYSFSGIFGGVEKEIRTFAAQFQGYAFWNPSVVINDQGEATVSFKLPGQPHHLAGDGRRSNAEHSVGQQINKVISSKKTSSFAWRRPGSSWSGTALR
ncbi:MAG: hypothetical protein U1F57_06150 [bacterium]